jgi:hypothetical protein
MNATRLRSKLWAAARFTPALVLLAAAACYTGRPPEPAEDEDEAPTAALFVDVTAQSGILHTYQNGQETGHYSLIESLGAGVALLDYDGDGLLDVFVTGGGYFDKTHDEFQKDKSKPPGIHGHPCKLYKNLGNFRFKDVTHEVGLDKLAGNEEWFYSHGVAVCDFDRDGYPDLLVTGWHRMALFHNVADPGRPGGRRFVEVGKQVGLPDGLWTTCAAWADLDGDGWPDLYVCQYVDWSFESNHPINCSYYGERRDMCPPKDFTALPHRLFHNVADPNRKGGRRFVEVSKQAGLRVPRSDDDYQAFEQTIRSYVDTDLAIAKWTRADRDKKVRLWMERLRKADLDKDFGKGLGVLAVDVNGDGKPDLYVANDTTEKFLYMNRSKPGQILLEELGTPTGTARDDKGDPNGSMGVTAFDYDHCGRPALWVANYEGELHGLYHNECTDGRERFFYATQRTGIAAIGLNYVGWGTGTLDLYHDGWESIFVSNGHVMRFPKSTVGRNQRPVLLQNLGKGDGPVRFKDISDLGGPYFLARHDGRGAALGDLDNDGRIDIVLNHLNEPVTVLKNNADTSGNHWLGVDLFGKDHADVVGVRIALDVDGVIQYRFAQGGGSYASSGDRRHVFGLGKAVKVGRLTVTWPNGDKQRWDGLAIDRYWRLIQGQKDAVTPPRSH